MYISILNQSEVTTDNQYLRLRVLRDTGVNVHPDVEIKVNMLNTDENGDKFKQFFNTGDGGVVFNIDVLIKTTDTINNISVLEYINNLYVNMLPVSVVTDAIDIPDGTYLITSNKDRNQTREGSTVWSLEFTKYNPLKVIRYKNSNQNVLNAIKEAKEQLYNRRLSKCNYKTIVYSKKKKIVNCVLYMEKILYKKGFIAKKHVNGWFDKNTKKAVKKYQKAYNKKHKVTNTIQTNTSILMNVSQGTLISGELNKTINTSATTTPKISKKLKVTGKVDKATWKALCKEY